MYIVDVGVSQDVATLAPILAPINQAMTWHSTVYIISISYATSQTWLSKKQRSLHYRKIMEIPCFNTPSTTPFTHSTSEAIETRAFLRTWILRTWGHRGPKLSIHLHPARILQKKGKIFLPLKRGKFQIQTTNHPLVMICLMWYHIYHYHFSNICISYHTNQYIYIYMCRMYRFLASEKSSVLNVMHCRSPIQETKTLICERGNAGEMPGGCLQWEEIFSFCSKTDWKIRWNMC